MTDTPTKSTSCCQESASSGCVQERTSYRPGFDIRETDNELILYGDLPGVSPENLDIRFENGELTIHGKVERPERESTAIRREYGVGDFHRVFSVTESIDADAIAATLEKGVLTLNLPKAEEAKPRRIKVNA